MSTNLTLRSAIRLALANGYGTSAASARRAARYAILTTAAAASAASIPAYAQDPDTETIVVTGTRIRQPGVVSSSPIYSIGEEEILRQQEPEIEKLLRLLPITAAGDNQNVNNGTEGAATIDLRGLGTQRNLVMMNGKRMVPFSFDGEVDTAMIPTALIERIDIVTGGASAVYGSDAISGALNVILKNDFEGVDIQYNTSQTGEGDGQDTFAAITLGANAADGRGNIVLSFGMQDRDPVTLGQRPLGRLGITTANGANYNSFLAGTPPAAPAANCSGPDAVLTGGSGTTLPTRVSIAGGPGLGQFRNDGTLGANCSTFNFNPYNYYQTPLKRYNGTVIGNFEFDESVDAYAMFNYGKAKVQSLVAPSGIFGSNYFTPLANPFITPQARALIIQTANNNLATANPTVNVAGVLDTSTPDPNDTLFHNWNDNNNDGVVDVGDDLNLAYFRRTVELGARSEDITGELFQFTFGLRGDISDNWSYDASVQYGESNRMLYRAGYTNVQAVGNALQTLDGTTCLGGAAGCVPINLFGGFGAITPEMAAYASASAFRQQDYEQVIASAFVTGSFDKLQLPSADSPVAFSFGVERRDEFAREIPDECLKVQPTSCLGGAGGFFAPLEGSYDVSEIFAEALIPIVDGARGAQGLDFELGYRYSDYNPSGSDDTWKAGLNWRPIDPLLFRVMRQRAARAPNVGELADPQVTGLANATMDPCSVANAGNFTPTLTALCISTGMSAGQVGTVDDIIVGQINTFEGTLLTALPQIEHADTTTVGFVWTPDLDVLQNPVFSLDYYDIDISNYIDTFSAQEVLDGCYVLGLQSECAKVRRVGGNLILDGSGVEIFTQNLKYIRAAGIELGFSFGIPVGRGDLQFSGTANHYLTHEFQSRDELPVVDCVGYFGTSCEQPRPELRMIQRTTWNYNNLSVSAQLRHLGKTERELPERTPTSFVPFLTIDSINYWDLYASYRIADRYLLSFGAMNITDEDPPVVGNEAGDTAFNSGNTFPGVYETLGRTYTLQVNIQF